MAALDFPGSPSNGQTYTANGLSYTWDGTAWRKGSSDSGIPSGCILLWSGAANAIPSGWYLCDGNNSTPDLRNRFVVGAGSGGSYSVGDTGGSSSVTLSTSQLPAHTHGDGSLSSANVSLTGSATYVAETWGSAGQASGIIARDGGYSAYYTPASVDSSPTGRLRIDASHSHDVTGSTGSTGSGSSVENRPPYYALCYIMKS